MKQEIEAALLDLRIPCAVVNVYDAPQVTRYQLKLGNYPFTSPNTAPRKIRVAEVNSRIQDIEVALGCYGISLRQDGKLWLEIPKDTPDRVHTRKFLPAAKQAIVPVIIGTAVTGEDIVIDMSSPSTPHVLIGGSTGSGKSTAINSILSGIVLTKTPQQVGICLADPKYIELDRWQVEHLVFPIANEPAAIKEMLTAVAEEMESRYTGQSSIDSEHIVIVIDEFADLIIRDRDAIEDLIIRIAQKGRAAGLHLILATQRPSADIVTGAIKANFPVRIAFALPAQVDSRIILDTNGAERLRGYGDGLIRSGFKVTRFQGAFTENIDDIVNSRLGAPRYSYDEYIFTDEDWEWPAEFTSGNQSSNDAAVVAAGVGVGCLAGIGVLIAALFQGVFVFFGALLGDKRR